MSPRLPLDDPDADAARDVIARRDLEAQLRAVVDSAGLPEDEGDEIVREALDFGDGLDLDKFAALIEERARGARPRFPADET